MRKKPSMLCKMRTMIKVWTDDWNEGEGYTNILKNIPYLIFKISNLLVIYYLIYLKWSNDDCSESGKKSDNSSLAAITLDGFT